MIKNLKSKLENFNIIKISQGVINFSENSLKNVNLIFKSDYNFKVKGDLEFPKLASKLIFDLVEKDNFFDFIIQQKINEKNIIRYRGDLRFSGKYFLINGQGRSNFIDANEISNLLGNLSSIINSDMKLVNASILANEINLNFKIDKFKINESFLDSTQFDLKLLNNVLKINAFNAYFNDANINGDLSFFNPKKFSGRNKIKKLLITKEYFGLSKIDLFDGIIDCSLSYKGDVSSNNFEKIVKSINSTGNCSSGKIKVSGADFAQIAKTVDQINDFPTLMKIINKKILARNLSLKRLH